MRWTRQQVAIVLVVALLLICGLVWWMGSRNSEEEVARVDVQVVSGDSPTPIDVVTMFEPVRNISANIEQAVELFEAELVRRQRAFDNLIEAQSALEKRVGEIVERWSTQELRLSDELANSLEDVFHSLAAYDGQIRSLDALMSAFPNDISGLEEGLHSVQSDVASMGESLEQLGLLIEELEQHHDVDLLNVRKDISDMVGVLEESLLELLEANLYLVDKKTNQMINDHREETLRTIERLEAAVGRLALMQDDLVKTQSNLGDMAESLDASLKFALGLLAAERDSMKDQMVVLESSIKHLMKEESQLAQSELKALRSVVSAMEDNFAFLNDMVFAGRRRQEELEFRIATVEQSWDLELHETTKAIRDDLRLIEHSLDKIQNEQSRSAQVIADIESKLHGVEMDFESLLEQVATDYSLLKRDVRRLSESQTPFESLEHLAERVSILEESIGALYELFAQDRSQRESLLHDFLESPWTKEIEELIHNLNEELQRMKERTEEGLANGVAEQFRNTVLERFDTFESRLGMALRMIATLHTDLGAMIHSSFARIDDVSIEHEKAFASMSILMDRFELVESHMRNLESSFLRIEEAKRELTRESNSLFQQIREEMAEQSHDLRGKISFLEEKVKAGFGQMRMLQEEDKNLKDFIVSVSDALASLSEDITTRQLAFQSELHALADADALSKEEIARLKASVQQSVRLVDILESRVERFLREQPAETVADRLDDSLFVSLREKWLSDVSYATKGFEKELGTFGLVIDQLRTDSERLADAQMHLERSIARIEEQQRDISKGLLSLEDELAEYKTFSDITTSNTLQAVQRQVETLREHVEDLQELLSRSIEEYNATIAASADDQDALRAMLFALEEEVGRRAAVLERDLQTLAHGVKTEISSVEREMNMFRQDAFLENDALAEALSALEEEHQRVSSSLNSFAESYLRQHEETSNSLADVDAAVSSLRDRLGHFELQFVESFALFGDEHRRSLEDAWTQINWLENRMADLYKELDLLASLQREWGERHMLASEDLAELSKQVRAWREGESYDLEHLRHEFEVRMGILDDHEQRISQIKELLKQYVTKDFLQEGLAQYVSEANLDSLIADLETRIEERSSRDMSQLSLHMEQQNHMVSQVLSDHEHTIDSLAEALYRTQEMVAFLAQENSTLKMELEKQGKTIEVLRHDLYEILR